MFGLNRIPWRYYGVWLLPLGSAMGCVGYGTILFMWPVFFPVITKELGWSAAVAATATSLARMEGGFEGPAVGYILDRWGARIVMFVGGILMGVGLIALNFMTEVWQYYLFFGIMINLGYNAGVYTSSYKAVANWWVKWRARAISIMTLPVALAGTFGPAVAAWTIATYGWRFSTILMGAAVLIVYIPTSLLVRPKRPEAYGLLPDGDDPQRVLAQAAEKKEAQKKLSEAELAKATLAKEVDVTTGQALKSRTFWTFSIATVVQTFAGTVVILFVPSHLSARGYTLADAAFFAGLMMFVTYAGRFIVLAFADTYSPKWFMVAAWLFEAAGCLSLANATIDTYFLAWGYGILYGIGYGIQVPLSPSIRGWLFGRTSFGLIGGIVSTVAMIGSISSPPFAGWIFDTTGTYYTAYTAWGISFAVAALIFATLKRPAPRLAPTTSPQAS